MRTFHGVEELRTAVGTHLGHSAWQTVTQAQIDAFADATGDHQWIHVDPERASEGPFGRTIAHGFLTLSLMPILVSRIYRVEGMRMAVNYGANKLRFPAPVPSDSRIRAGVEILSLEAGAGGHQLVARATVECDAGEKPACVVDSVSVLFP